MPEWHRVARADEIREGEGRAFAVAGRVIALFRDGGSVYAIDDTCPHAGASLAQGSLVCGTVVCSWHGWRFNLRDGSWADYSKLKIGAYAVRVLADAIEVELPETPGPA